jgi:hypothetical protein
LWAGSASAVTFNGGYSVTLHTSTSGGTALAAADVAANPFNFDLNNVGDSTSFDLFKITIMESIDFDQPDDLSSNPISVNFAFTLPGSEGGTVNGSTTGQVYGESSECGLSLHCSKLNVVWDGPIDIDFSGIGLQIALSDIVIDCKYKSCDGRDGNVAATFALTTLPPPQTFAIQSVEVQEVAITPLPAALPMFATGLGLVGGVGYWRRRKAKGRAA